jgi:hypothetical protein
MGSDPKKSNSRILQNQQLKAKERSQIEHEQKEKRMQA